MDVIVQRPAALDVHKERVTACVRVPGPDGTGTKGSAAFGGQH
jgi:hypothetical protein